MQRTTLWPIAAAALVALATGYAEIDEQHRQFRDWLVNHITKTDKLLGRALLAAR